MKLIDALKWRYATKKMNGQQIPADKLNNILEAIKLAPSSLGLTPYKVIVVEDAATRKLLQPHFYNQSQIVDGSAVIVFANWTNITEKEVAGYMQDIAEQRNVPIESLNDFSNMINGSIKTKSQEEAQTWAAKQTYIALGFGLVAAAAEQVDATPMEGFNPDGVDEVLGLKALGLHSAVALTLGYRDEAADYLANVKKVRYNDEKLFIKK